MNYKTELHCHTKEVSPCSKESAGEVAAKYIENGYSTLVVTNHARSYHMERLAPDGTWADRANKYFDAVELVREAAGDKLTVLAGMEVTLHGDPNDYLVYGITRELLVATDNLFDMNIGELHYLGEKNGFIVIQAHPLRFGMRMTSPDSLDGYEIMNGHPYQSSHNDIAQIWGRRFTRHQLILTSGSDNHYPEQTPNSGIITEAPITSTEDLLTTLRGGNYELIDPGF